MIFNKPEIKKRVKTLSKKEHTKQAIALAMVKVGLLSIVAIMVIVASFGVYYAKSLIDKCPDISEVDITPTGFTTVVLDSDGNEIETLTSSGANRTYVDLEDIPLMLQYAFVAIEDERFYEHNGIDLRGIIRAAATGISSGDFSQGASTITQQLLKNNYFTTWTSETTFSDRLERKIQEQYLAIQLETIYTKDEILENYLNTINLGQNTLGVEAAAERYFGKSVTELTLSECAVIAGITQNPTKYNPISNPDENATRRKKVLKNMLSQGYITEAEYEEALADDVYTRIAIVNDTTSASGSTSYFVDALTDAVYDDLVAAGYSESEAYSLLYSGGLTIKSTQNSTIQAIVEEEINNNENYDDLVKYSFSYRLTVLKADGTYKSYSETTMLTYYQSQDSSYSINYDSIEACDEAIEAYKSVVMDEGDTIAEGGETITYTLQPQAAMTVIDQSTGYVVAQVGGRGEKTASKTLNRATGITRQPGSCFKIIACYAAALDAGGLTLATVQNDEPMDYADGKSLSNYNDTYLGFTTIRLAITKSINIVTVKTLTQIGTGLGYEYATALGISTLEAGDNNQTLCLGGITNGVTNLELTNAFATIANGGEYNEPVYYTEVIDHDGNVILSNLTNTSQQVLSESTAWLLTSAMEDVMTSGTASSYQLSSMVSAGKTGTTTKNRDTVFVGYTPYYTIGVWGGYDDNSKQSYTAYSRKLWKAVMERINSELELESIDFEMPDSIVTATVCSKSGLLAIDGVCDCDPRGSTVYEEYFLSGTEPTEYCDHHIAITICNKTNCIANEYCPKTTTTVYITEGSEGTDDTSYIIPDSLLLLKECTTHTESNTSSEKTNTITQKKAETSVTYTDVDVDESENSQEEEEEDDDDSTGAAASDDSDTVEEETTEATEESDSSE